MYRDSFSNEIIFGFRSFCLHLNESRTKPAFNIEEDYLFTLQRYHLIKRLLIFLFFFSDPFRDFFSTLLHKMIEPRSIVERNISEILFRQFQVFFLSSLSVVRSREESESKLAM